MDNSGRLDHSAATTARQYLQAGISVVPIRSDGSKAAACAWKRFQETPATVIEVDELFGNGCGIAAITGKVSGFLEVIDCEADAPFHDWLSLVESQDSLLAASLVIINTPSGGHHVVYRCPEGIAGNQKLAMRLDTGIPKVLIETRGEGGYVLTVGCPASCHPAGKLYTLLQGDLIPGSGEHSIPVITADQRSLLLAAARSFNEIRREKAEVTPWGPANGKRPGDVIRDSLSWAEILEPYGWRPAGHLGDETLWRRPGKITGFSATSNFHGSDLFYVFSTNAAPFEHETSHSKFMAYTLLNHGGDFGAAARAIADKYRLPKVEAKPAIAPAGKSAEPEEAFAVPSHWRWLDVAKRQDWNCAPLRWTVQDLIAQGTFVIIAAETQTGKTLLGLFLSHSMLHSGQLFGKLNIAPVDKILYMGLEDPDRRFEARLEDIEQSFPKVEEGRFIVHIAPSFTLTDERMVQYLEQLITAHGFQVVFLDTYQKATPGLTSFDDEKQAVILHRLANLCRKLNVTIIVLDHVRKRDGIKKRETLSVDDIKGTGAKPQNADCIILVERTPDRKQVKLQSFSKDSDQNIRIVLDVSAKGSSAGKFTYVCDLEQLGTASRSAAAVRREKALSVMSESEWMSCAEIARKIHGKEPTVRRYLAALIADGKVESEGVQKYMRYRRLSLNSIAQHGSTE